MATSGNFSNTFSTGYTLKVAWTESGVDVGSNTSDLTVTVYLVCSGNSSTGYYINSSVKKNITLTVNGTAYTGTCSINAGRGETVTLFTQTISDIPHNADGSKTVAISCTTGIKATLNGSYVSSASVSGNAALTTIARGSQPSCITWPEHTQNVGSFGETISIHMNRNSDAFTHTVRYAFGSFTGTCINAETGKATNKDVTTGFKWTIPKSLMDLIPNDPKGSGTIYVDTYNGSTLIDTRSCGFTATVPTSDDCYPSCSLVLEVIGDAGERYNRPVKGLTQVKVTVKSTLAYSSPIESCTITVDGKTYSGTTVTTDILKTADASTITATVTDKRKRSCKSPASYTMTVLDYHSPSITKLNVNRCDVGGNEDDQGEYVKVTLSTDISSLEGSLTEHRNTATYTLRYKMSSESKWQDIDMSGYKNVYSLDNEEFIFRADGNSAYDVEATATDYHSSSTRPTSVSTAFTLMNFHSSGTGIRFGGVANTPNAFQNDLALIQTANHYSFTSGLTTGGGYVLMARITVLAAYADTPMTFVFSRRIARAPMTVHVTFAHDNSTDPAMMYCSYEGANYEAYLSSPSESVWDLYVKKAGENDEITLNTWHTSGLQMQRSKVEFVGNVVSTVPTGRHGYYRATPLVVQSIIDCFMPVGFILHLYNKNDPNEMYPGTTWVRIENRFLWAIDSKGQIGNLGGEASHVLTVDELPAHSHGSVYSQHAEGTKNTAWYTTTGSSLAYGAVATGGGQAHNNMPPYVQVSVWRRTA